MGQDVFISYKSEEFQEADWVRQQLESGGISCWMAPNSITGSIDAGNVRAEGRTALRTERDAVVREHLPDGFEHVRLHEQHGGDGTGKHVDGSV